MKQIKTFLTMCLLTIFSWGMVSAADLPIISPADGSADVWYHIRLEQRIWGIGGSAGVTNGGSIKGYYFDEGVGTMIRNIEDGTNEPGSRWKVVATAAPNEYQLISGLGNTIDYAATVTGDIKGDRYYSAVLGAQVFTILNPNGDYLGLSLKGTGGIDKSNNDLYFDKYGPDAAGGAISFVAASPLTDTYLFDPAAINFGPVPVGKSTTKTLTIAGVNLTENLTYSIDGAGFSFVSKTNTANGGTAEITFTPTEKKNYSATVTISANGKTVTTTLTGKSDFNFPFQISDETGPNQYWYYIQFERQAVNNKVLQAGALSDAITQTPILGNENKQLWKIVGDWNEYRIVNKADAFELKYNMANNSYGLDDFYGDEFGFEPYNDTEDWQLRNESTGYREISGIESPTKRYLNDLDAAGDSITNYPVNNEGNRLVFISSTAQKLVVGLETVEYGSVPTGIGATVKKLVAAGGLNTTGAITAEIQGEGAAAFTLTSATLPAVGGEFEVVFTPTAVANYNATLVIKSAGMEDVTVKLTGKGRLLPFKVSSADASNEYWYQIQFARQPLKVITNNGTGTQVTQEVWDQEQAATNNQLWKITGTWDNFKIVSKLGGELFSAYGSEDYEDYIVAAAGDTHIALEKTTGTNLGWGFQNVKAQKAGDTQYINDRGGATVCLYGYFHNDEGGVLNFIPASAITIKASTASVGFIDIPNGLKSEKTLTVTSKGTTVNIDYALSGADASAFTVTNTTEGSTAGDPLVAIGGTLKISFNPTSVGEYVAVLTLSSAGAEDVKVVLAGNCIIPELPVTVSDDVNTTWYTVAFTRSYTSANTWKVWTAGLEGETIKQTTFTGRTDTELITENQLWKFVVAPSKTGYLAVAYSDLAAQHADDYVLAPQAEATPLSFKKVNGTWVLMSPVNNLALNDRARATVTTYSSAGTDGGNPLVFMETTAPDPVRIQILSKTIEFDTMEAGAPAIYSSNVIVKGYGLTGNINLALAGDVSAYSIVRAADSTAVGATLPQSGDTLKIIFNPSEKQVYNATLTLTATGASSKTIALSGSGALNLPIKLSTAAAPVWYYIGFTRQYDNNKNKVLSINADTLVQRVKIDGETAEANAQLWRFNGTLAAGYQIINHDGTAVAYDTISVNTEGAKVNRYRMKPEADGDYFRFAPGMDAANAGKWQMRNVTNAANGSYLCDASNLGLQVTNYSKSDAGNWLTIIPLIPTGIKTVPVDANDPVTSSVYYTIQGIKVQKLIPGNVYIRIDTHASKKTTAAKFFLVK
ncbi:hypothetical protein AGMMS50239_21690 [Bacteroidia bacterium]|nr:hypothetical protein AGMMS50239_21690 [Bacteroidia bacterium]